MGINSQEKETARKYDDSLAFLSTFNSGRIVFYGNLIEHFKFTRSSNNSKQQAEFPTILDSVANYMILLWLTRSFRWQLLVLIGWGGVGWTARLVPPPRGAHPTCYLPTYHTPLCAVNLPAGGGCIHVTSSQAGISSPEELSDQGTRSPGMTGYCG